MSEQPKDPKIERAEDAYDAELGTAGGAQIAPPLPSPPVPNPVEDKDSGIAP